MTNLSNIKLGIVAGSTDWLPSDIATDYRLKLIENYKEKYGEEGMYECPICVSDNEVSVKRALRDLHKADCDALCLYYANYGPESAGTLLASEFNGPVMMIGAAEDDTEPLERERRDAMSGFVNACYALEIRNVRVHIPPRPIGTIEKCADMIHDFMAVARTVNALRNLKIISFSPRPSSYLAAYAPMHAVYKLGADISEYSELELFQSYKKHENDERIKRIANEMAEELRDERNYDEDVFLKSAQYEITLNDWIRVHKGEKKHIALTSTCWPAFPVSFGFVPCYVNSRLTRQGIPVACEVDVYGALSEFIGQYISGNSVTLLNINNNIPKLLFNRKIRGKHYEGREYSISDLFLGYHCGVTSSDRMETCALKPHFVNYQLIGKEQSQGTIQGRIVPGPITIFRIQSSKEGELRAYVAQGQILPVEVDTYGGYGVIAIPEFVRFFRYVVIGKHYPNHTIVLFGHYADQIIGLLRLTGVRDIEYNHPSDIPYENETVYDSRVDWF